MPTYLYPCMIKLRRKSHNLSQTLLYWASKQPFALCSFKASYNVCPVAIPELFSQTQGSNYWQLMPSSNITKGILTFINTLNPFTVLGGLVGFSPIISKLNILFLGKRWKDYNTSTCGRKIINNSYENTGLQLLDRWRVSSIEFLIAYNLRSKIPFVSISHVEGKAPMIGPIAPSDDSNRTVHFSQPNTSRHDLWIGPQVFHIMFDTIEVTENTKSTYHRLLYTLHVLSFDDDISLFSISVCLSGLTILSSCKSLLLSLSSIFAHPVICFFSRE